ncbi:MAG TPA: hypothetical protein VF870_02155 [Ignavibacteriaceae bacterium]
MAAIIKMFFFIILKFKIDNCIDVKFGHVSPAPWFEPSGIQPEVKKEK